MSEPKYHITYDFDARGEPPKVIIRNNEQRICEVDEMPICHLGGRLVEIAPNTWEWQGPWSWEEEDWVPGPIAAQLLAVMNRYM